MRDGYRRGAHDGSEAVGIGRSTQVFSPPPNDVDPNALSIRLLCGRSDRRFCACAGRSGIAECHTPYRHALSRDAYGVVLARAVELAESPPVEPQRLGYRGRSPLSGVRRAGLRPYPRRCAASCRADPGASDLVRAPAPLDVQECWRCRDWLGSSQSATHRGGGSVTPGGVSPTPRHRASREADASRSSRSQTQVLVGTSARESRFGAQTGSRPVPAGLGSWVCHRSALVDQAGVTVQSPSRARRI